jgi:hypothetical protein
MSCVSGLANFTSNLCVNYDAEVTKWKAAFPTPDTIRCTTALDCNSVGVYIAGCVCGSAQTGALPYCKLGLAPNAGNALQIAEMKQNGLYEMAGSTCENVEPADVTTISNSDYCFINYKSTWLAAACPIYTSFFANSYQCYDQTQGICNGASAIKSSVVVTMIVAIVAFFTTQ